MYTSVGWFEDSWLSPDTETGGLPDSVIPMQFTGLLDKNGVEIYESDIVKGKSKRLWSQKELQIHVIKWGSLQDVDYPVQCFGFEFPSNIEELEVIGNIYENPELLKGEK